MQQVQRHSVYKTRVPQQTEEQKQREKRILIALVILCTLVGWGAAFVVYANDENQVRTAGTWLTMLMLIVGFPIGAFYFLLVTLDALVKLYSVLVWLIKLPFRLIRACYRYFTK